MTLIVSNILHNKSALARVKVKFYYENSINTMDNVDQFQKQVERVVFRFSSNRAKLCEIGNVVLP